MCKTINYQREHERRSSHGGYIELNETQKNDAKEAAAAAAREQYRQQLRANKKKIQDSLQGRKSLMERHDGVRALFDVIARA